MKPTVQNPDYYTVGNDYAQAPLSEFYNVEEEGKSTYQDGIYTKLADTLVNGTYSADPWKDPHGFNKRTYLEDPSASYTDDKYGQANVIYDGIDDPTTPVDPKKLNPGLLPGDEGYPVQTTET